MLPSVILYNKIRSVLCNKKLVSLLPHFQALPKALQAAAATNIEFRRGLPLGYLKHAGLSKQEARSEQRKLMKKTLKSLVTKLVDVVDLDVGVDEMGLQLMHDALPPVLNKGN